MVFSVRNIFFFVKKRFSVILVPVIPTLVAEDHRKNSSKIFKLLKTSYYTVMVIDSMMTDQQCYGSDFFFDLFWLS